MLKSSFSSGSPYGTLSINSREIGGLRSDLWLMGLYGSETAKARFLALPSLLSTRPRAFFWGRALQRDLCLCAPLPALNQVIGNFLAAVRVVRRGQYSSTTRSDAYRKPGNGARAE